jgi:hypothetical protein
MHHRQKPPLVSLPQAKHPLLNVVFLELNHEGIVL